MIIRIVVLLLILLLIYIKTQNIKEHYISQEEALRNFISLYDGSNNLIINRLITTKTASISDLNVTNLMAINNLNVNNKLNIDNSGNINGQNINGNNINGNNLIINNKFIIDESGIKISNTKNELNGMHYFWVNVCPGTTITEIFNNNNNKTYHANDWIIISGNFNDTSLNYGFWVSPKYASEPNKKDLLDNTWHLYRRGNVTYTNVGLLAIPKNMFSFIDFTNAKIGGSC